MKQANNAINISSGYFGIGEIISLEGDYQERLLCLMDSINNYISTSAARPLNIYLEAEPGSGKSFLVKQISRALEKSLAPLKTEYLERNLSSLQKGFKLSSIFQAVQSANITERIPIVFIDEVDSVVTKDESFYQYFLLPMYDSYFFNEGEISKIGKCILFFAASNKLDEIVNRNGKKLKECTKKRKRVSYREWIVDEQNRFDAARNRLNEIKGNDDKVPSKLADFLDRIDEFLFVPPLNLFPIDDKNKKNGGLRVDQAKLIAMQILLRHHRKIEKIELMALDFIANKLIVNKSKRIAQSIILRSSESSDNVFYFRCLPWDERNDNKNIEWIKNYKQEFSDASKDPSEIIFVNNRSIINRPNYL